LKTFKVIDVLSKLAGLWINSKKEIYYRLVRHAFDEFIFQFSKKFSKKTFCIDSLCCLMMHASKPKVNLLNYARMQKKKKKSEIQIWFTVQGLA
jgi:hypothetical protein